MTSDRRAFELTLNLTQAPGSANLEGTAVQTIAGVRFVETITSGTQTGLSLTFQTVYMDPAGQPIRFTYNGTVDSRGTEMNGGTLLGGSTSPISTWAVRR